MCFHQLPYTPLASQDEVSADRQEPQGAGQVAGVLSGDRELVGAELNDALRDAFFEVLNRRDSLAGSDQRLADEADQGVAGGARHGGHRG